MTKAQSIVEALRDHLALPWPVNVSGKERVVMVVYPPTEERRIRRLIETGEFQQEIRALKREWIGLDVAPLFSEWMSGYEYADRYMQNPERLWDDKGNVRGLEEYLFDRLSAVAVQADPNTVLALIGCGGLFGFFSVSRLIEIIVEKVPGRLVVFFPGEHDKTHNTYRLLGAKDGWGYLAVTITG